MLDFCSLGKKSNRWRQGHIVLCCGFFVMPSKIKMQTSQYRKFRIWEMQEDKCTKSLAKNQVCAIINMRDICPDLYGFVCLEGYKYGHWKLTEISVFES